MKSKTQIIYIFVILISIAFIGIGSSLVFQASEIIRNGIQTKWTVVDIQSSDCAGRRRGANKKCYSRIIQFDDENNNQFTFTESSGSSRLDRDVVIGEDVVVYYNKENPQEAIRYSLFDTFGFPSIFIVVGSLLLVYVSIRFVQKS